MKRAAFLLLVAFLGVLVGLGIGRQGPRPDRDGERAAPESRGSEPDTSRSAKRGHRSNGDSSRNSSRESDGDGVVEGWFAFEGREPAVGVVVGWVPEGHEEPLRSATTDALGRFRFDGLPSTRGSVALRSAPWPVRIDGSRPRPPGTLPPDDVTPSSRAPAPFVEVSLERLFDVRFDLRYPDGSSPEFAVIETSGERHDWTPGSTLRCRALSGVVGQHGETHFSVEVAGIAYPRRVAIVEERIERPITIDLPWPGAIEIDLGSADGPVAAHAYVAALPPGRSIDARWISQHGVERLISDRDSAPPFFSGFPLEDPPWDPESGRGRIRCEGLPPATYAVGVARQGRPISVVTTVTVERETVTVSLELPGVEAEAIPVRVLAPDRSPAEAELGLFTVDAPNVGLPMIVTRGEVGEVRILLDDVTRALLDDRSTPAMRLRASHPEFGECTVPFDGAPVTVQFAEPARIEFEVVDENPRAEAPGEAAPGAIIVRDPHGRTLQSWWIGSETPPVPIAPGFVELTVVGSNAMAQEEWVRGLHVELRPGTNRVVVPIPRRHSLVILPDGERAPSPYLQPIDEPAPVRAQYAAKVVSGAFHYFGLAPGEYALGWPTETDRWMPITIPTDREVIFAPQPIEALRVIVGGAVVGGPFRDGDVIAVDDRTVCVRLRGSHSPGVELLAVRRSGRWIEVEASPADLRAVESAGGAVVPTRR